LLRPRRARPRHPDRRHQRQPRQSGPARVPRQGAGAPAPPPPDGVWPPGRAGRPPDPAPGATLLRAALPRARGGAQPPRQRRPLHDAAVQAALAAVHADRVARGAAEAVLVAHLFAAGGRESPDSERPLVLGGAAQVTLPVLAEGRWSYVALGHLHQAQPVGERSDIRYSGAPLATSFGEAGGLKSANLVEIVCGRAAVRELPLTPLRPLVKIAGPFEELLASPEHAHAEDAYVQATYTDGYVLDATARLRRRFPHLLQALPAADLPATLVPRAAAVPRVLDEGELLQGFWQHVEGEAADPELAEAFARVVAAVRARD